jgi:hypothetical protein
MEPVTEPVEGTPVCPATAARCKCGKKPGHEPPHTCVDQDACGGAWLGMSIEAEDFEPVAFPIIGEMPPELFGFLGVL